MVLVAEPAAEDQGDDLDAAARGAVQEGLLLGVAKGDDELGEEVRNAAVGDGGGEADEDEGPGQRVGEGFAELVGFEVAVSDAWLVYADAFDGQAALRRGEPPGVELVVGHEEEEEDTHDDGEGAGDEEDGFPGGDGGAVFAGAFGDVVGDQAAEDLSHSVEAEPDSDPGAVFAFGVPLRGEEHEARRDGGFEDAEEEADGDGGGEVFDGRH